MKRISHFGQSEKIYQCVDELMMEDVKFYQNQPSSTTGKLSRNRINLNSSKDTKNSASKMPKRQSKNVQNPNLLLLSANFLNKTRLPQNNRFNQNLLFRDKNSKNQRNLSKNNYEQYKKNLTKQKDSKIRQISMNNRSKNQQELSSKYMKPKLLNLPQLVLSPLSSPQSVQPLFSQNYLFKRQEQSSGKNSKKLLSSPPQLLKNNFPMPTIKRTYSFDQQKQGKSNKNLGEQKQFPNRKMPQKKLNQQRGQKKDAIASMIMRTDQFFLQNSQTSDISSSGDQELIENINDNGLKEPQNRQFDYIVEFDQAEQNNIMSPTSLLPKQEKNNEEKATNKNRKNDLDKLKGFEYQKKFLNSKKNNFFDRSNENFYNSSDKGKAKSSQKQFRKTDSKYLNPHSGSQEKQSNSMIQLKASSLPAKNPSFNISHQQLQFLSLLYPNQQPQQLMIKLLSYYQKEQQYKNSFQQIVALNNAKTKIRQKQKYRQNNEDREKQQQSKQKELFIQQQRDKTNNNSKSGSLESTCKQLSEYTKLKEQCLAALGSQMVQTQIKSASVQTSNVNFYTRQYAMPQIFELVSQKNEQEEQNFERMTNPKKFISTCQSFKSSMSQDYFFIPDQFIYKVYIPANVRGQFFDMDYQSDGRLFQYLPENDFRRTLRDINHLIQKVLLYHRHNSYLKKKNNFLFKGWNLALLILLLISLIMLSIESMVVSQENTFYVEVLSFFMLSFILILILGNAFNNYKKDVKRSSLIKDVCQEISNYFDFINCSKKRIKWVLGKDFFWIEIWITVKNR